MTFVRQERGPYAGWWLLPGGKVEFGEPVTEAARREAAEESGCDVGELALTGAYEIFGPGHHFVMWAYRSEQIGVVPERFAGHTSAPPGRSGGTGWSRIRPTCRSSTTPGAAAYPREMIATVWPASRSR